jgi:ribosomal protein S24E
MKFEVVDHRKNPLIKRDEFMVSVDHSGRPTPSRSEMTVPLAKELKAEKDLLMIDEVMSVKGLHMSKVKAFVYHRKEDMPKQRLEVLKKRVEKGKKAGAEGAATPVAEAAAEKKGG